MASLHDSQFVDSHKIRGLASTFRQIIKHEKENYKRKHEPRNIEREKTRSDDGVKRRTDNDAPRAEYDAERAPWDGIILIERFKKMREGEPDGEGRSEEHTSELQSHVNLV